MMKLYSLLYNLKFLPEQHRTSNVRFTERFPVIRPFALHSVTEVASKGSYSGTLLITGYATPFSKLNCLLLSLYYIINSHFTAPFTQPRTNFQTKPLTLITIIWQNTYTHSLQAIHNSLRITQIYFYLYIKEFVDLTTFCIFFSK